MDLNLDSTADGTPADDDSQHFFDSVPELPSPGQRWTTGRKACVLKAIRGGWVPVEEACRLYSLSAEEIVAWERDIDRHGDTASLGCEARVSRFTARPTGHNPQHQ